MIKKRSQFKKKSHSRSLRIAQIGSLWESTPPPRYGGTERVVYNLTQQLVAKGHQVTLFACGTSKTSAELVAVCPRPLFRDGVAWTNVMYPLLNITAAFDRADDFDIIHVHLNKSSDYLALPLSVPVAKKVVVTLHFPYPTSQNRLDRHAVLQKYKDLNYVSISNAQRLGGENLNWLATVHNGIDLTPYAFNPSPKDYFIWIGKFNPDKGVHLAIEAVKKTGQKLILGGKIDHLEKADLAYYESKVKPHIDNKHIMYVGELDDAQKNKYFGEAIAFLNPIQWNEPFGLVMAESLACGTPVIAYNNGASPEIITDQKTGFLVHSVDEMVKRMKEVKSIDRKECRARAEQHFSAEKMTAGYLAVYQKLATAA